MAGKTGWLVGLGVLALASSTHAEDKPRAASSARAVERSPWVAVSGMSFRLGERANVPLALGLELGAYVAERLRFTGRLLVPVAQMGDDCAREDIIYADATGVFTCLPARNARLVYEASAGVVVYDTAHLVIAPGLGVLLTDVSDHGVMLGASVPVEWVTSGGLHLGLELGVGAALAQTVYGSCRNHVQAPCDIGSVRSLPNLNNEAGFIALSVGWSLRAPRKP